MQYQTTRVVEAME
jgi:hypothetical protein